jgi:hypothetical protein
MIRLLMQNESLSIVSKLIKYSFIIYILYLILSNFTTFLLILVSFCIIIYIFIYTQINKLKQNLNSKQNFNFNFNQNSFHNFNENNFSQNIHNELKKAKEFFGFYNKPTKDEIKKQYRKLAKKYHPDVNNGDDINMKKLNLYRDILLKNIY